MDVLETAKLLAIKNAARYGKADLGKVLQKLMGMFSEERERVRTLIPEIRKVVEEVNSLPKEELLSLAPKEEKKKEVRKVSLPNAEQGKVITRFPPEPSGYLHIGHAKAATLNYVGAREYGGKMILRFDDTNPENAKEEYENAIREDIQWLDISPDAVSYTSDNLELIYGKAKELISKGKAYVCFCSREEISENRRAKRECEHRAQTPEKNLEHFEKMLNRAYGEGEALLRYKGNMESPNTTMRDPTLARVILKPHYRKGTAYAVWPSYDLAVVVMDGEEGITHAIRSKEYELRGELYHSLLKDLGYGHIELIHISRLFIPGYPISKREIRALIKEGKLLGWDDPRLLTIRALRRRGILPEALRKFSLSFGLGKQENPADLELLLKENRKLLDASAERYFFVPSPLEVRLRGHFPSFVELKKHPTKDLGKRTLPVSEKIFISEEDWRSFTNGEVIRLKGLSNAIVDKENGALNITEGDGKGLPKVQWLPLQAEDAELVIPSAPLKEDGSFDEKSLNVVKGKVEPAALLLEQGSIVQFERVGFARLDDKERRRFIFSC